jgi:hypothetical protein
MIRERIAKTPVGPQSIETTFSLDTEDRTSKSRVSPLSLPNLPLRGTLERGRDAKNLRKILRKESEQRSSETPEELSTELPPRTSRELPLPKQTRTKNPGKTIEKTVEIPRPKGKPEAETHLLGLLHCPSTDGSRDPLLRQSIPNKTCAARQAGGYHKCSFCLHGKPRDSDSFRLPPLENSPSHLAESRM